MSNQPRMRLRATTRTKLMACEQCGQPVHVGRNKRNAMLCLDCRIARSTSCAHQMHDRSGPYWDKWIAGMIKAIREAH